MHLNFELKISPEIYPQIWHAAKAKQVRQCLKLKLPAFHDSLPWSCHVTAEATESSQVTAESCFALFVVCSFNCKKHPLFFSPLTQRVSNTQVLSPYVPGCCISCPLSWYVDLHIRELTYICSKSSLIWFPGRVPSNCVGHLVVTGKIVRVVQI